jgi:hypothetical protein
MRIQLAGLGEPIPGIALPDPNISGDRPSQTLVLENGSNFEKAQWVDVGYTHYEVWCVGAAGGRGGGVGRPEWAKLWSKPSMPSNIWELYKEQKVLISESGLQYVNYDGTWWHESGPLIATPGWYPGRPDLFPYGATDYWVHWADYLYPNRDDLTSTTWQSPFLFEEMDLQAFGLGVILPFSLGGGGGGGGLHVVSGDLASLPDACPVVVGQAGVDSGPGQIRVNGPWTPVKSDFITLLAADYSHMTGYNHRLYAQITPVIEDWANQFPGGFPTFLPPQPGGDGGASSFGGDICQASGGKGGKPAVKWETGIRKTDGDGGAGGIGGQLTAGGGAAGSIDSAKPGSEGNWLPDIGIGKGGGGGKGGVEQSSSGAPKKDATNGGRGAMSYADTSIYGRGEVKTALVTRSFRNDYTTGTIEWNPPVTTNKLFIPGGGGGARAMGKFFSGSRAPGYSPNGLVLIRLVKVV